MFPADNIWNRKIAALPTQTLSNTYMRSIGLDAPLHPGFGAQWRGEPLGIPFTTVPGDQPLVPLSFLYGAESDPGPYPIPQSAPVEVNIDHHVLVVERGSCTLYELYKANRENDGSWYARSGAYWRLDSNDLRPDGWTSADAAGLPILPGLVRYDEVMSGAVRHALRFTVPVTSKSYVWPARHSGGESDDPNQPPMGIRLRLKANVDISRYPAPLRVLFQTLKDYGMFLADNGDPPLNVAGAPDERWDNNMLVAGMESLRGSDFEVVDESSLMIDPDSGQSR